MPARYLPFHLLKDGRPIRFANWGGGSLPLLFIQPKDFPPLGLCRFPPFFIHIPPLLRSKVGIKIWTGAGVKTVLRSTAG
jgi:hypothetical protein